MMRDHPVAHLIVGVIAADASGDRINTSGAKLRLELLTRLAKALALRGDYALSINRERDGPHIFVALADSGDVAKLAGAVNARGIDRYPGWASQRSFRFDEKAARTIGVAAPLPRPKG
jgi:hypothetical protein